MSEYKDYYWLNKNSRKFLQKGYLAEGQTPEERIRQIAEAAERILGIEGFADKFEGYMKRGFFSLSSPVWSNFGNERGLPISCNGSYIADDMASILTKQAEVGMMTKYGSGTSGYFGALRPRGSAIRGGGESNGPVHFMNLYESVANVVSQSSVRRGSFAAYLPIDHPDILEFLQIKDEGFPVQDLSFGVCVSDEWMQSMVDGDKEKRKIWTEVIKTRVAKGYPYIFFSSTVNNNKPQVYKDKNLTIWASNLCSEICLPSSPELSFVCNLSSYNLLHWEEIVKTDAIETLLMFLDAVMTEYIEKTANIPYMEAAHKFAKEHRALGAGVLGWHSFLQSKMIPVETDEARKWNVEIWSTLHERGKALNAKMAELYGEPEILKGYKLRNTTLFAIAPTKSSSFILGQPSEGIELIDANFGDKALAKGGFDYKNPELTKVLDRYDKNNKVVWKSILLKGGSVQHLDFLSDLEKRVFKTWQEVSQMEIIIQAAERQQYIDQSQSLNLKIHPDTPIKEMNQLLIQAWMLGVKTLYYHRGVNAAQELARDIMSCSSCEA